MKKKYFNNQGLLLIALLLATTTININCKSKAADDNTNTTTVVNDLSIPPLFERKGELAKPEEWIKTKEKVAELNQKITRQPGDVKSRLQIATIYISEARVTGEHPYYYPAILKILDGVLAIDSKNFEALVYKSSVKMSQHQFAEAKDIAEKAKTLNPDNAYVYGILTDANVELGNYEEAVKMSDKMQALKPSLESYSRASYLREIYGDYPGSIQAMKMAVDAGLPGSEPQCWARKTLAHLYEKTGKWDEAENQYNQILAMRPSYAFALEGLAKVDKQRKNYQKALEQLDKASAIMPEYSFEEEKGNIYILMGEKDKAKEKYSQVLSMLAEDEKSGHISSLEKSRVYRKLGEYEKAMQQAKKEYEARPANIDVNQEIAWVSYQLNKTEEARQYIKMATRTGSKDPELLEKVASIGKSNG
jgi:tetratricopeptide (TPR) repeat protein